ncbi:hypothetical protein [Cytobacillus sp. NCCP-133]|uniref:hypothetical protein n=1 Tax=Cytobacillus sp. NCCP-133 TaxID=766848 RepID=UPI0022319305|nr:hypothetical protein [Cytobacillus sp. NCCP-133]GLB60208.1 hypothetical protein NCCP133_23400 [Cytobacillus sp. NCCP-133]
MHQASSPEAINQFNDSHYYANKKILIFTLKQFKYIKVPTKNYSIEGLELANWLLEVASPKELHELITLIKYAQMRNADIRPILQTAAAGLL